MLKLDWYPCGDEFEDKESASIAGLTLTVLRVRREGFNRFQWTVEGVTVKKKRAGGPIRVAGYDVVRGDNRSKRVAKLRALRAALKHAHDEVDVEVRRLTREEVAKRAARL